MRVASSLVTAAWLLTLAEPCLRPPVCGTEVQHQCCCAEHEDCPCHLKSPRAPAAPPVATAAQVSQDRQSLPAGETGFPLATQVGASALARTIPGPVAVLPPVYLSSHAFRC